MFSIQRLSACAQLDPSPDALERARAEAAAGDESWQQWVAEYESGDALIIRLQLTISYSDGNEAEVHSTSRGLFVQRDEHPAKIERQIAELACDGFVNLAQQLCDAGYDVDTYALGDMYVHVELGEDLRRGAGSSAVAPD